MNCLWLTREDPRCAEGGDLRYSLGLLQSLATAGADVTVLCHGAEKGLAPFDRSVDAGSAGRIHWKFAPRNLRFRPLSLLSPLPGEAFRLASEGMRRRLRRLLDGQRWDFALVDDAPMAWVLGELDRSTSRLRPPPSIVYVSHGSEISLGHGALSRTRPLRRCASAKFRKLERRVCARADLITTTTVSGEEFCREAAPGKPVLGLMPGYDGDQCLSAPLSGNAPRTALYLGSFHQSIDRMNLLGFIEAARRVFPREGIRLQIVGKAAPAFVQSIIRSHDWCRFAPGVAALPSCFENARLGVIAGESGAGVNLNLLDYLFHHLPVTALTGIGTDIDFEPGVDFLDAGTPKELPGIIARSIDDSARLAEIESSAFAKHASRFDWADRGERLLRAMEDVSHKLATAGKATAGSKT